MKSGLLALLLLSGCTEITKTDWNPPNDDFPETPTGAGGSVSHGSGGFGAGVPVPETGVVGGYNYDPTRGGQILSLPFGPHRVFAEGEGVILAGGSGDGLPSGGSEIITAVLALRFTAAGYQEYAAYGYSGEGSSVTFGGAVADDQGNLYLTGGYRGQMTLGGITLQSVVNPGVVNPDDYADEHGKPSQDTFIFKLDRWGRPLWVHAFGGVADQAITAVALAPDGSLVVTGSFTGDLWFGEKVLISSGGSTLPDLFFLRISADGLPLIASQIASDVVPFRMMAIDSEGGILLGGKTRIDVPMPTLQGYEALEIGSGGFVLKLDSGFVPAWVTNLGQNGDGPDVRALAVDHAGNAILVGDASGASDLFGEPVGAGGIMLAKVGPDGVPVFGRTYGSTPNDVASAVTVLSDDSIVFTGSFRGDLDFGGGPLFSVEPGFTDDVFVARIDSAGQHVMSLRAGGLDSDYGLSIAALPSDRVVTAGTFANAIDFGSGIVTNQGGPYVAWLTP